MTRLNQPVHVMRNQLTGPHPDAHLASNHHPFMIFREIFGARILA